MASTWGSLTWNVGNWGSQANSTVSVSGLSLSSNLASVTTTATVDFGWGRLSWGENAWGEQGDVVLTGLGLNSGLLGENKFTSSEEFNSQPSSNRITISADEILSSVEFNIFPKLLDFIISFFHFNNSSVKNFLCFAHMYFSLGLGIYFFFVIVFLDIF